MTVFTDAFKSISLALGIDAVFHGTTIRVLFKNSFVIIQGVETRAPIAECLDTDIPGVIHGDVLTINSVAYKVIGIEPADMGGYTTLILSKDPPHG